jgi:hypothetical protein
MLGTLGYALNESQEVALYGEIEREIHGIKVDVVDSWLKPDEPLAGGYGRNSAAATTNWPSCSPARAIAHTECVCDSISAFSTLMRCLRLYLVRTAVSDFNALSQTLMRCLRH